MNRHFDTLTKLRNAGINYSYLSDEHIRIDNRFDVWPSTGRWKEIGMFGSGKQGKQIARLIKAVLETRSNDEASK